MSSLQSIINLRHSVQANPRLSQGEKLMLDSIVGKAELVQRRDDNPIKYFFEDVTGEDLSFEFSTILDPPTLNLAKEDCVTCTDAYLIFSDLDDNPKLNSWLQSAIKFTDHMSSHYLEVVMGESPVKQGDAGKERSRYIQLNRAGCNVQRAGRILDNLYDCRNKMEHRSTKISPSGDGKVSISRPKYKPIAKQIKKRYPEALLNFIDAYGKI